MFEYIFSDCGYILENRLEGIHRGVEQQDLENKRDAEYYPDEDNHSKRAVEELVRKWSAGEGS